MEVPYASAPIATGGGIPQIIYQGDPMGGGGVPATSSSSPSWMNLANNIIGAVSAGYQAKLMQPIMAQQAQPMFAFGSGENRVGISSGTVLMLGLLALGGLALYSFSHR